MATTEFLAPGLAHGKSTLPLSHVGLQTSEVRATVTLKCQALVETPQSLPTDTQRDLLCNSHFTDEQIKAPGARMLSKDLQSSHLAPGAAFLASILNCLS